MKKIRLPQPYASMVVRGILQTIPDMWGDVKHGEKIFIYADDFEDEFNDEPDYTKPLHRKIYNEFFLGNLPDFDELPTQCFIGSVRSYHTGELTDGWSDRQDDFLFVVVPRTFTAFIKDFNVDEKILDEAKSKHVAMRSIERKGRSLFVPVGNFIWQTLKDRVRCVDLVMFWEDYMKKFAARLFTIEDSDVSEITDIHFKRSSHTLSFASDYGVGQSTILLKGTKESVFTLAFNLAYQIEGTTMLDIGPSAKEHSVAFEESSQDVIEEKSISYLKKNRPFISFISTPMGGMTRWKRR